MPHYSGIDIDTRERVLVLEESKEFNADFWAELRLTKAWQEFVANYTVAANQLAIQAILRLYPTAEYLTLSQFIDGLRTATLAGEFENYRRVSKAAIETPVDPRTESQKRWASFTEWSLKASSREIQERARTDRQYAAFRRGQYQAEMNVPIDGATTPANEPQRTGVKITPELRAFADEYNAMPVEKARMMARRGSNPHADHFNKQLNAAIAAGLVR